LNSIEFFFKNKVINRNGIFLYSKEHSIEFVKKSKELNVKLLGIDGFYLTEITIQPSMRDSIDFSKNLGFEIHELALSFLEERSNNLFFEIVY
jgi:hypothetical protein